MGKLNFLNSWTGIGNYLSRRSAQSYLNANQMAMSTSGGSSSCGSDDSQPQPSACGAGDDKQPKPSACGSSCGSDDK